MGILLDSDAVKNALYDAVDDISRGYYAVNGIEESDIERIIDSVPPAQPERKKGHWIRHEYADIVEGYYVPNYECSECHSWKEDDSDFCPDCGTDMR